MTKTCEAILYVKYNNVGGGIFKKKEEIFRSIKLSTNFYFKVKTCTIFCVLFLSSILGRLCFVTDMLD